MDFCRKGCRSAAIVSLLLTTCLFLSTEILYRMSGGLTSAPPGMTGIEFLWQLYHLDFRKGVVVVGDSRVGWGFSPGAFDSELSSVGINNVVACNAGMPGTGVEYIIRDVLHIDACRSSSSNQGRAHRLMVLGFSPTSFYYFGRNYLIKPTFDPNLSDLVFDRAMVELRQKFACLSKSPKSILSQIWRCKVRGKAISESNDWVSRNIYPDGIINARLLSSTGNSMDLEKHQTSSYRKWYADMLANQTKAIGRRNSLQNLLREAKSKGWDIVMVRMPTSEAIRKIESTLPGELQPEIVAREVGVDFIDYRQMFGGTARTIDGSHLTPFSARMFSRKLAADLSTLIRAEAMRENEHDLTAKLF